VIGIKKNKKIAIDETKLINKISINPKAKYSDLFICIIFLNLKFGK